MGRNLLPAVTENLGEAQTHGDFIWVGIASANCRFPSVHTLATTIRHFFLSDAKHFIHFFTVLEKPSETQRKIHVVLRKGLYHSGVFFLLIINTSTCMPLCVPGLL